VSWLLFRENPLYYPLNTLEEPWPLSGTASRPLWVQMIITYGGQTTTWYYPGEWAQGAS
jgi:hypothetical protein